MKHEHLDRIAYPSSKIEQIVHKILKPMNIKVDKTLFKNFTNALIHYGFIRMYLDPNSDENRFYFTARGESFEGKSTMRFIAKCLVDGIPFENVTPLSHTHSVITDFDCADLGIIEDVKFLLNDSGSVKAILIDGVDFAPFVSEMTLKDIAEDLKDIEEEQRIAAKVNSGIQSLKEGE